MRIALALDKAQRLCCDSAGPIAPPPAPARRENQLPVDLEHRRLLWILRVEQPDGVRAPEDGEAAARRIPGFQVGIGDVRKSRRREACGTDAPTAEASDRLGVGTIGTAAKVNANATKRA